MGNKGRSQKLRIQMKYVPAPDVDERVSRALGILLRAAARHATLSEKSANAKRGRQAPVEGASTGGDKGGDPGGRD
jgi:hypothetical protein